MKAPPINSYLKRDTVKRSKEIFMLEDLYYFIINPNPGDTLDNVDQG